MEDLEKKLRRCEPNSVKLIVVDGVFSMEGDLANLPEIVRLKKKYDACIYVDEAHGLGVFGKNGRGVCDHFGLTDDIDLIMGTFSKSLASIGGFIAGDKEIINWLKHTARSYIFQASSTPSATAAALEALHILQEEPERIEALWEITSLCLTPCASYSPSSPFTCAIRKRHSSSPRWHSMRESSSIPLSLPLVHRMIR